MFLLSTEKIYTHVHIETQLLSYKLCNYGFHSRLGWGLSMWSLHVLPVFMWVSCGCSGFTHHQNMHVRSISSQYPWPRYWLRSGVGPWALCRDQISLYMWSIKFPLEPFRSNFGHCVDGQCALVVLLCSNKHNKCKHMNFKMHLKVMSVVCCIKSSDLLFV